MTTGYPRSPHGWCACPTECTVCALMVEAICDHWAKWWELPDDPFALRGWSNPLLPAPVDGPRITMRDDQGRLRGTWDADGWHRYAPDIRVELTSREWAELMADREPQFPRPISVRSWLEVQGYTPLTVAWLIFREERDKLAEQARGRIRFREGVTDGVRFVRVQDDHSPGAFQRWDGAPVWQRSGGKGGGG